MTDSKKNYPESIEILTGMIDDMPRKVLKEALRTAMVALGEISKGAMKPPPPNEPHGHLLAMLAALGIGCEVSVRSAETGEELGTESNMSPSEGAKAILSKLHSDGKLGEVLSDVVKSLNKNMGESKSPEEVDELSEKLHAKILETLGDKKGTIKAHASANLAVDDPRANLLALFKSMPEEVKAKMIEKSCDILAALSQGSPRPPKASGGDFFINLMKVAAKECGHVVIEVTDEDLASPEAIEKAAKAAAEAVSAASETKH